ncbi:MAG: O-methyltransferase [Hyphomicrobiales bacterium]|nr:MAG: O-methyltransferase [Hyphomicrobiales bacterium]
MSQARTWAAVDAYIEERLLGADPVQAETLRQNAADGLRPIDVSPAQGKFLHLVARMIGARRILEIGTLGGYSSIWLARALPADGRLVTLEYEPRHAETARRNIARAGFADRIEVRVGAAADTLPLLAAEGAGPFDLVFIDADKPSNPVYLDWALKLSRPGTVIVLDNVVRDGAVADARSTDDNVRGSRAAFDFFASHPRIDTTALQTVGSKGYDGFAIGMVS